MYQQQIYEKQTWFSDPILTRSALQLIYGSNLPLINPFSTQEEVPVDKRRSVQGKQFLKEPRNSISVGVDFKNFLSVIKGHLLKQLKKFFGEEYNSFIQRHHFLHRINKKNVHMAMQDYEKLYEIKQIQEFLAQIFKKETLYRSLMLSRTDKKNKSIYASKIKTLKRGFEKKKLRRLTDSIDQRRKRDRLENENKKEKEKEKEKEQEQEKKREESSQRALIMPPVLKEF